MDTIFNMPMDEAEARYLSQRPVQPMQQAQQRGLADYLPNVFGGNPAQVAGLLGEQQAGAISRQANVSGLLGAAIAIANGMSSQGPRRSAAQNILNALGTGLQTSQGVYQNALQQGMVGQRMAKDAQEAQLAQLRGMSELQKQQLEAVKQQRLQALREKVARGEQLTDADLMELNGDKFVESRLNPKAPQTVTLPNGDLGQWNPTSQKFEPIATKPTPEILSPQRAAELGLDTNAGQWVLENGKPSIVNGTENPSKVKEYNFAKQQGFPGSYIDYVKTSGEANAPKVINNLAPDKKTTSDLQGQLITTGDAMIRLNQIESSYRPEYQNLPFRTAQAWSSLKDKFGGLDAKSKTELQAYSVYRQNAITNMNKTIKDLTGAAMGVQEAERIMKSLPNPGQGLFDGDSPAEFEAKMGNAVRETKMAMARYTYTLRKGLSFEGVPLSEMPQIINSRAKEIAKQNGLDIKNPRDVNTIKRQLSAEFGITAD